MARDIHELEVEFAKSPTLEACIPLCEAYLGAKRFMEAMVVCKKGIKSAPDDVRGPVMLARIYLEQGKAPKAEQELAAAVQKFPNNPFLLEMQGRMFLESGRRDEGIRALTAALTANPNLPQAQAMLRQLGVPLPQQQQAAPPPQAPPPQRPAGPPPQQQAQQQQHVQQQQYAQQQAQQRPPQQGGFQAQQMPAMPPLQPPPQQQQRPPQQAQQQQAVPPPQQPRQAPPPQQMQQTPSQASQPPMPVYSDTPSQPEKQLEHVNDFFAPDTLGFANDTSGIETAGPGRLTILGFVPKTTGSIKTTIMVALGVLAVAMAWMGYQLHRSSQEKKLAAVIRDVRSAIDDDVYARYIEATKRGEDALKVDDDSPIALSTLAYAHAVLAVDHQVPESVEKARGFLEKAEKAGGEESAYRIAARALMAYYDKQYDVGISAVKKTQDRNINDPKIEVEAFRLLLASKPAESQTQVQERRLSSVSAGSVRAQNFLGWYYYIRDVWDSADAKFAGALQSNRNHPQALLGKALVDLDRAIGLKERQVEVEANIKKVFAQEDDLSQPVKAMAYFARSQLEQFQNKHADSDADFKKAQQLDPANPIFDYRRGVSLLALKKNSEALAALKAAAAKAPNDPRYFKRLAEAQMAVGDAAGAEASLNRVTELSANDPEVKILNAQRLRSMRQYDKAITVFESVSRELGPEAYTKAQMGISQTLRESGRSARAVSIMMDFLSKTPAGTTKPLLAQAWCELGQAHETAKNTDAAMTAYQTGIDEFLYEPTCHYFYCRALGGGPEAKQQCELYVTLAPNGEFAADAKRRAAGGGAPKPQE